MRRPLSIGLLSSDFLPATLTAPELERAAETLSEPVTCTRVSADDLRELPPLDLVVSALGAWYPESGWPVLLRWFRAGGRLLTVGCRPFTCPYGIAGGRLIPGEEGDAALHTLGHADTCVSTGEFPTPQVRDVPPRFAFLLDTGLPPLADTCSLDFRLALRPQPDGQMYAVHGQVEAQLEVGCRLYDAAGRPVAAPIVLLEHFDGGLWLCANFEPQPPQFYKRPEGTTLLGGLLRAALSEGWQLEVQPTLSRYYPDESVRLEVRARVLNGYCDTATRQIRLSIASAQRPEHILAQNMIALNERCILYSWEPGTLPEGRHVVTAVLEMNGRPLKAYRAGFFVLSDKSAHTMAQAAPALQINPAVAPDYCTVADRPYPVTGSTYMARGPYRDCFSGLNVTWAAEDMTALRSAGVNILRAGVWTNYARVYDPKGGFRTEALRALDAYFLCAAQAGLPVQFVFAAFVWNHWERNASVFHDPALRTKVLTCVRQFAERYADWPGVQADLVNEPSYAPFRDGCLWQLARPIGDPNELAAWQQWLRRRYAGDVAAWRAAWGEGTLTLSDFSDASLPKPDEFETNYDGPATYTRRAILADFYAFADDSWTEWCAQLRDTIRQRAPNMLVMIGRDETLRIPSQQRDAALGSIDLINWHQWHREGVMFNEYVLNRVRKLPCCGQEMGVLCYKDQRNRERLTQENVRDQLERKMLYCLGNWIQWQSHCDPTMHEYKETKLGLYRVDGTERPLMGPVRLLSWLEAAMAPYLVERREQDERLALVVPTSLWFSSDSHLAYQATMAAIVALHNHCLTPAYAILEHLLTDENRSQIGEPRLIILPSATVLAERAWQFLIRLVRDEGATLLVTGSVEQDEYWRRTDRLSRLGLACLSANLATIERLRLNTRVYDLTFRQAARLGLPGKALYRDVPAGAAIAEPVHLAIGNGRLIYCPLPIELADSIEPTIALYRSVLAETDLPEPLVRSTAEPHSAAHWIYPIAYRDITAITVVNEGTDATIGFRLSFSGTPVAVDVAGGRGAKLFFDAHGELMGAYLHGRLQAGALTIVPGGEMALARSAEGWRVLAGTRTGQSCFLGAQRIPQTVPFVESQM